MYRIGFDVGGTKIKVVALSESGQAVYLDTKPTPLGAEQIYNGMSLMYNSALNAINYDKHTVGVGIPGNVARPSYLLDGTDVYKELEFRLNHEIKIENDANCFALAEANMGAGIGANSVFGVILGTGVGGGVVIDGRIYKGHSGLAGEWGHTPLYSNGKHCWCGAQGCAEQYISGKAVEKLYRENSGVELFATDVFAKNDVVSACIKHEFYNNLAQGLANIINYYDPEVIVIGGGIGSVKEIYEIVPAKVELLIFNRSLQTKIVPAILGPDAGAVGAALL